MLAVVVPVPLVALGPGPTFNTLGKVDDKPVIAVQGLPTYPPSGNLNLTTVSVTDRLTLAGVLNQWAASDRQVVPRSAVYTPGLSDEQVQEKNAEDFARRRSTPSRPPCGSWACPSVVAVADVVAGSAADGKLKVGDRISTVDGTPVADPDAVNRCCRPPSRATRDRGVHPRRRRPERHAHAGIGRGLAAGVLGVCWPGCPRTARSRSTSAAWAARRPG